METVSSKQSASDSPDASSIRPSDRQNVSFLDADECLWGEESTETIVSRFSNVRSYHWHGEGQNIFDQDLSASLDSGDALPTSSDLNKVNTSRFQDIHQIPFHCNLSDCTCTGSGRQDLYADLPSPQHIRLLEILPGVGANVECLIHLAKLSDVDNAYEVLSYPWGTKQAWREQTPIHKIYCNSHEMEVGDNLFVALQRVRNGAKSRVVWVDALCINQKDLVERSQQVRLMSNIFGSAAKVLIWLEECHGWSTATEENIPPFEVTYRAFSAICGIVNGWRDRSPFRDDLPVATHSPHVKPPDGHSAVDIISGDWPDWELIFRLFSNEWFHRVWVIQEAVLAKVAIVYWNECEIMWTHVGTAAAIIRNNFTRLAPLARGEDLKYGFPAKRSIPSGVTNAYFMYRMSTSQSFFEPLSFNFHELLKLSRPFRCKDDRDRIYGLLGIPTSDGFSSLIKPDYTKSTQQLYLEVARHILDSSQSLSLLSSVQTNRRVADIPDQIVFDTRSRPLKPFSSWHIDKYGIDAEDYPSWVPQWQFIFTSSLAPPSPHPAFSPSGDKSMRRGTCGDKRLLQVRGIIVDVIRDIQEARFHRHAFFRGYKRLRPSDDPGCWPLEGGSEVLEKLLTDGQISQSRLETLSQLLTGGKTWYGFPIEEGSAHLADYSRCLLMGGCLWSISNKFVLNKPGRLHETELEDEDSNQNNLTKLSSFGAKQFSQPQSPRAVSPEIITVEQLEALAQKGNADRFLDACATAYQARAFFTTLTGLQGLGPQCLQEDDVLCILYGAPVPFVIRPDGEGNYLLVGECYVPGIMEGAVVEQMAVPGSGLKEEWITLV